MPSAWGFKMGIPARVPLYRPFLMWTPHEGLLLGFTNAFGTENKALEAIARPSVRRS